MNETEYVLPPDGDGHGVVLENVGTTVVVDNPDIQLEMNKKLDAILGALGIKKEDV